MPDNRLVKSLTAAALWLCLSSAAFAQSANPVIESGGCNANLSQGTGYFTVDPTGRNCEAFGPSPLGWY
jgi:opacity protein-like surface antigen